MFGYLWQISKRDILFFAARQVTPENRLMLLLIYSNIHQCYHPAPLGITEIRCRISGSYINVYLPTKLAQARRSA
jgi:hypothetical protein